MKILTVYHGDFCVDGWTSAWLSAVAAKQAGYEEPELYHLTYRDGQEAELQQHIVDQFVAGHYYDIIYILDISLSLYCLETLTKTTSAKIIMLDHHKTAFDRYAPDVARTKNERASISLHNGRVDIALNNGMSGAGMSYIYFFPNTEMPLLVKHVQDRDIWTFEMEHTKPVDQYLKNQVQTIENWTDINATMCHAAGYHTIIQEGQILLDAHEADVIDLAHTSEWITIGGSKGLMVECGYEYASDVGAELCKDSGTFGLTYFTIDDEDKLLQVSLRSEGDYDVEAMAKRLGGGGHKNAAGFIISSDKFFSGDLT